MSLTIQKISLYLTNTYFLVIRMHHYSFFTQLMYSPPLRNADLINIVSVKKVLLHLSKIYVVEDNFGDVTLSEFSTKARTILEKME